MSAWNWCVRDAPYGLPIGKEKVLTCLEHWTQLDDLKNSVSEHGRTDYLLKPDCVSGGRPTVDRRKLTERAGFEPAVQAVPVRRFSKPLVSATHPPLQAHSQPETTVGHGAPIDKSATFEPATH